MDYNFFYVYSRGKLLILVFFLYFSDGSIPNSLQKNRNWESAAECRFLAYEITIASSVIGSTAAIAIHFTHEARVEGNKITIYFCRLPHMGSNSAYVAIEFLHCLSRPNKYFTTNIIFETNRFCYILLSLSLSVKFLSPPPTILSGKSRLLLFLNPINKIKLYKTNFYLNKWLLKTCTNLFFFSLALSS